VRVLGVETATWTASVAVIDDRRVLAERSLRVTDSHARTILPLIELVLGEAGVEVADLGLLAVSIGPGSFTGLRIGLSVAKGIALATGAAVTGVCTLEALARAAEPRPGLVCPVLDARKGEVYGATFRWERGSMVALSPPVVLAPRRFAERIEPPCLLLGDGVDVYREIWSERFGSAAQLASIDEIPPRGAVVAALGVERFRLEGAKPAAELEPMYVRRSEAELNHVPHTGRTIVERGKIDREGVVG
jgi:tRNA threonylcarbamoyladenosine biosynthesis protein TsaB